MSYVNLGPMDLIAFDDRNFVVVANLPTLLLLLRPQGQSGGIQSFALLTSARLTVSACQAIGQDLHGHATITDTLPQDTFGMRAAW